MILDFPFLRSIKMTRLSFLAAVLLLSLAACSTGVLLSNVIRKVSPIATAAAVTLDTAAADVAACRALGAGG